MLWLRLKSTLRVSAAVAAPHSSWDASPERQRRRGWGCRMVRGQRLEDGGGRVESAASGPVTNEEWALRRAAMAQEASGGDGPGWVRRESRGRATLVRGGPRTSLPRRRTCSGDGQPRWRGGDAAGRRPSHQADTPRPQRREDAIGTPTNIKPETP
eukprot:GHVT01073391.1.p2 GENE.GHVT01073391.1~~GHVT01073391.1.p2  ORF type:complete len:156 (+),score=31.00 GHVT01073391.1:1039-1506(+)